MRSTPGNWTPFDASTQAILDAGTRVGALARDRYPGGILVDVEYFKVEEGLARTATILRDPSVAVIYEGFIAFNDVVVRPDILVRTGENRWRLIEVKSTAQAKAEHRDDLAIQAYVLTGAGLALDATCLLHVNTGYLYPRGAYDLQQLFQEADLTREVQDGNRSSRRGWRRCGMSSPILCRPRSSLIITAMHHTSAPFGSIARRTSPGAGSIIYPGAAGPTTNW